MTDLEKKALEIQDELKGLKDKTKDLDVKSITDGIEALQKKFDELPKAIELKDSVEIKALDDALNKLNTDFKAIEDAKPMEIKTFGDAMMELKDNKEFKTLVDKLKGAKGSTMSGVGGTFEVKADILTTALTGTQQRSSIDLSVDKPLYRMPFMRQLVANIPTDKPILKWVERTAHTDNTGGVAENNPSGQSDSTWENKSRTVVKRGVHAKYTNESFEDVNELVRDLQSDLMTEMELDIDNQMYTGDGTGTNFHGLVTDATDFNATTAGLALKVVLPNFGDVLKAAALQARLKHFNPDVAAVNPSDFALLELEKDTQGNYVLPPFKSADGTLVAGMRIVQNTNVTVNTALVFDSSLPKFYVAREMQLKVWDQNEDDALNDRKTVTLWFRGQMRIRENEKLGLITIPDIAAAITALTKA